MTQRLNSVAACVAFIACVPASVIGQEDMAGSLVVWNHAYQENYSADDLANIASQARGAYVLLDPFKDDIGLSPQVFVQNLRANGNQVSAYISVGTGEDWRNDFAALRPSLVERQWGEWAGEYFVSTPGDAVLAVVQARIDLIAGWGFDWVEFDNMDWAFDAQNRAVYGIAASKEEAAQYFRALCAYVQDAGMRCMAKSTVAGADMFDGVTYESYPDEKNWWDEAGAKQFLSAGKPVIIVHCAEPDCTGQFAQYRAIYGTGISFICEDPAVGGYVRSGFE